MIHIFTSFYYLFYAQMYAWITRCFLLPIKISSTRT